MLAVDDGLQSGLFSSDFFEIGVAIACAKTRSQIPFVLFPFAKCSDGMCVLAVVGVIAFFQLCLSVLSNY